MSSFLNRPAFYKISFIVAIFLLLFISGITYRQMETQKQSERMVMESNRISLELERLFSFVKDAETAQRGYVITKDSLYLQPYFDAQVHIRRTLSRLGTLTADKPVQRINQAELSGMVRRRLASVETVISQVNLHADQQSLINTLHLGTAKMYHIRLQMLKMVKRETERLSENKHLHAKNVFLTPLVTTLITILALVVFVLAFVRINRDAKKMTSLILKESESKLLEESGRAYKRIIQGLPAALYLCDPTGKIVDYNEESVKLWGQIPEEGKAYWCGGNAGRYADGRSLDGENNPVARVLRGETVVPEEMIIVRPDGEERIVLPHPQVLLNDSGEITGALNMYFDITELKANQRKLNESELRLRVATESAGMATWDLDFTNLELIYSERMNEMFALPAGSKLSQEDLRSYILSEDRHIIEKASEIANRSGVYHYIVRILRADNEIAYIRTDGKVIFNAEGKPVRMLGTMIDVTEQKLNEQKISESEQLFRTIALNIPDSLIFVFDTSLKLLSLDGDLLEKFGYNRKEFIGKRIPDFTTPERFGVDKTNYDRVLAGEKFSIEKHDQLYDRKFKIHYVPLRNSENEVYAGLTIALDITELRNNEERIERLGAIVESSDDGIISKNLDGTITSWNKGAERIFGYTEAEMLGESILKVIPEDRYGEETQFIEQIKSGNGVRHFATRRLRKDGTEIDLSLSISPVKDINGEIIGASKIARDITEQKEAERRLKEFTDKLERLVEERTEALTTINSELIEQKEFAETILNSAIDVNIVYDTEMRFLSFNKEAEKKYRVAKDDILGKRVLDVFPGIESSKGFLDLQRAISGELIHNKRYRSEVAGLYYEDFLIPLRNNAGDVYAVLVIARDITDLIKNEDLLTNLNDSLSSKNSELERSNAELASFNHVASHDLQEPLRKIQTFISRIADEADSSMGEKNLDYLFRIRSSANRMQLLIDDLLTFSRTNKADQLKVRVDLNETLENAKKELSQSIEEHSAVVKSDKLPVIHGIDFQFHQLFVNLIGNALKYSLAGKPVNVDIKCTEVSGEEIAQDTDKAFYKISVKDNGIGFDQKYAQQIFELFQRLHGRTEYTGTGIGLTICKKIVDNHNGVIRAFGEPGEGAEFVVYLPLEQLEQF